MAASETAHFNKPPQHNGIRRAMSDEIPLIPVIPQGLRDVAQRGTLILDLGKHSLDVRICWHRRSH
jgi:hypothetical protein